MEMKYGGTEARQFLTNLSLITSKGMWGDNIMTAEWVHQVSYEPGIVIVNVHDYDATADNIIGSGEFGVSMASEGQEELVNICGNVSGKKSDKLAALRELGFGFYRAGAIGAYMVEGAAMNLECRLIRHERVGDHVMFIGDVISAKVGTGKPMLFRAGTGIYRIGDVVRHAKDGAREKEVEDALARHAR